MLGHITDRHLAMTGWQLCLLLLIAVLAAYSNHFDNDFHFDDGDSIVRNPAIRDPASIPRFLVDPKLFSSAPTQRTYRPVTSASLAIDYWLAGRLDLFTSISPRSCGTKFNWF